MATVTVRIKGYDVLISEEDRELVNQYAWCPAVEKLADGTVGRIYFNCSIYRPVRAGLRLHRLILNATRGMVVDHINGNTLDCRRENLRICTNAENIKNCRLYSNSTSGYKGVCWEKGTKKWSAKIQVDKKRIFLGRFDDIELAYEAYKAASSKYHGEFGRTA
jgi:hypothetical protein